MDNILHLLKIEWLKVKYYKAFWIFLGLYLIGLFSINYIAYYFQSEIKKGGVPFDLFPYNFPKVYQTFAWVSSFLLYFPGMLMILIISNEYSFKTHRQNIIDGLSRQQFITAKIFVGLIIALLTTILSFIFSIGFGLNFRGSISFEGSEYILYGFVQSLCYIFLAIILAVLLRRSGLAIAIFFLYGLIFETLIGTTIDHFIFNAPTIWYYMPLQASDVLIPIPFGNKIIYKDAPSNITLLTVSMMYVVLWCFLTYRKFITDDL